MRNPMLDRRAALRLSGAAVGALLARPLLAGEAKSVNGRRIARKAMRYKGDRYVSGGSSPKQGFDCSGLTWYVFQKVANRDIGRTVKAQWRQGRNVKKGKWKPGDLVFFKNTAENGLSHVGIFIGGGKFVHAENEKTGVVVTPINSSYYTQHYAGARRL
ncbi:MAG TPA: C40 family peptidase [Thermomicrobiales bacterium]|nr:C40 family peptidase [Thermomicrobiales bacterium]